LKKRMDMRSIYYRLLPKSLGSRLSLSVLLAVLAVIIITAGAYRVISLLHLEPSFSVPFFGTLLAGTPELAFLFALFFAVSISIIVGLLIAREIGRSIASLSGKMQEQADSASSGISFTPLSAPEHLPVEFREIIGSFNLMMSSIESRDRKLSDALLQATETKAALDKAFANSLEGIILLHEGRIQLVNPSAIAHFALSPKALLGSHLSDAMAHASFTDEHQRPVTFDSMFSEATKTGLLIGVSTPERSIRWLKITVLASEPGGESFFLGSHDITEALRLANLRSETISLVSHDMKAPLTTIAGYLDILSKECTSSNSIKAIESSRNSISLMTRLIDDILSTTLAEKTLAPAEMLPVDLSPLLKDVCLSLNHPPSHAITCEARSESVVLGDSARLRQAIANLIINAKKYSPEGTLITALMTCDDGMLYVDVEDEGPGIPEEDRNVIFQRFTRLVSGNTAGQGMGFGLYIARTIIEAHGGTLTAETGARAGGALFRISLPAVMSCQEQDFPTSGAN